MLSGNDLSIPYLAIFHYLNWTTDTSLQILCEKRRWFFSTNSLGSLSSVDNYRDTTWQMGISETLSGNERDLQQKREKGIEKTWHIHSVSHASHILNRCGGKMGRIYFSLASCL